MGHVGIGVVLPVIIIELILLIVALVDCARARRTRGPKWVWMIVIVIFGIIGPVLYFVAGRDNR